MRWGRVCLNFNLVMVILGLIGLGVLSTLILTEFHDLPTTNIWQKNQCQVLENYQKGFYGVRLLDDRWLGFENLTEVSFSSGGLCAWDQFNQSLEIGQNVSCGIPQRPIIIEECSPRTPIINLIILDQQIQEIDQLMERHLIYYWSALGCGILSTICCFWLCYSYWFVWCRCSDRSYWYCGRNDARQFFNQFNLIDDIDESFRVDFLAE